MHGHAWSYVSQRLDWQIKLIYKAKDVKKGNISRIVNQSINQ